MSNRRANVEAQRRRLREAYEAAFAQWASQVNRLQSLKHSTPDGVAIEEVQSQVEVAQTAYRESRDLLAELLIAGTETGRQAVANATAPRGKRASAEVLSYSHKRGAREEQDHCRDRSA